MEQETTLQQLVIAYTKPLLARAVMRVPSRADAEDLVQDTFLAAAERYDGFRGESSPKTWLYAILNRKIADYYRKTNRMSMTDSGAGNSDDDDYFDGQGKWFDKESLMQWKNPDNNLLDDAGFQKVFHMCIAGLPKNCKVSITSKYIEGKDVSDICDALGVTQNNLWQLMFRAKMKLRDCLEHHWFRKNEV